MRGLSNEGEVIRYPIDEDLYAEKDRLQKQFIKDNPQEELSRLFQAIGSGATSSSSTSSTCPAGTTDTTCTAGTTDICAVEEVPAAEWRLTSVAAARVLPRGQQQPRAGPSVEEQQATVMIQACTTAALTDGSGNKVCY